MSLYAKCVVAKQEELEKDSCAKEFQAMRQCMLKVMALTSLLDILKGNTKQARKVPR
jgi:hypothetical protein